MKKVTFSLVMIILAITVLAQTPQAFKYQALVRDNAGEIIANQSVKFRISIHEGSASGTLVYQETHTSITNAFGLANLKIGEGTVLSGSFTSIVWGTATKFLKVELDPLGGNNYFSMGTSQLLSVPYALYAENTLNTDGADADPTNELNSSVNLNGTNLEVTDAGGTITTDLSSLSDDGDWTISGNDIYRDGGNIGIGTSSPYRKLEILEDYPSTNSIEVVVGILRGSTGTPEAGEGAAIQFLNEAGDSPGYVYCGGIASIMEDVNSPYASGMRIWSGIGNGIYINNEGNVGIGTTNPEFKFSLDNDGGILAKGNFGTGTTLTTSGAGARLIWYPKKAAFRAGYAYGDEWGDVNIGDYSTAMGDGNQASGESSIAMGWETVASEEISTAMGRQTTASGMVSTAMGWGTTASGIVSTAMGVETTASGQSSIAMGSHTEAIGYESTAMGSYTEASGANSTAIGKETIASGNWSIAMGINTEASGNFSTAMGFETTAFGSVSTAMGYETKADASYSTVLGRYNVGNGDPINWNATDPLFEIGNGTDIGNPSNAFTVLKNGKVGIGTEIPAEELHVSGNIRLEDAFYDATNSPGSSGQLLQSTGTATNWMDAASIDDGDWTISGNNIYRNVGNIGIGTTNPEFKLSLEDDGGILAIGEYNTGTTLTTSGQGTRLIWYPKKAAFRAGYADSDEWDDVNIGYASVALGWNTTASGGNSTAMGTKTTASGPVSTAMGWYTTASGGQSTAMGWYPTASGTVSTAMGYSTNASGNTSTAMGYETTASGWYSTAMGQHTTASGDQSTAMGKSTTASGESSTSMGCVTTSTGDYSTAMGYATTARAYGSTAIGRFNIGNGDPVNWNPTDPLFEIGNGQYGNPSNALTVLKNGNVGIGTTNPTSTLEINGNIVQSYSGPGSAVSCSGGNIDPLYSIYNADPDGTGLYASIVASNAGSASAGVIGNNDGGGIGVLGISQHRGVLGDNLVTGNWGYIGSSLAGVYGIHDNTSNLGYLGREFCGVFADLSSTNLGNYAVFADGVSNTGEGTGYPYTETLGGIIGRNYWGNPYTFGVAGYSDLDFGRSGSTFGYSGLYSTVWGCLAYNRSDGTRYGGYFTTYTTGTGKDSEPKINNGIGAWGDLFGADIHGKVYGTYTEGENYAMFSNGTVYKNNLDVHLQKNNKGENKVLYTNVSIDATVQTMGYVTINNGKASVVFDEAFAQIVSEKSPVIVTATPTGESKGVYITNVNENGFTVTENDNGKSNIMVSYIAIGKRKGYESPVLAEEVVAADYTSKLARGLHHDGDTETDGEGLYYENGKLSIGIHPSTLPDLNKPPADVAEPPLKPILPDFDDEYMNSRINKDFLEERKSENNEVLTQKQVQL